MISSFSFGMLKPDCLSRQLEEEAFKRIISVGLIVPLKKQIRLTKKDIGVMYFAVKDKPFYDDMSDFLISSDVVVFVVIGDNFDTVKILNRIVGSTDPNLAKEGTLRELGQDVRRNIAHSSSNTEEALKSIVHFFPNEKIVRDIFCSLNR